MDIINTSYNVNYKELHKKKKRQKLSDIKKDLKNKIIANTDKLWTPQLVPFNNIATNSCYNMRYLNNPDNNPENNLVFEEDTNTYSSTYTHAKRVNLNLTPKQKSIITLWFSACDEMYNETVKYIKSKYPFKQLPFMREYYALKKEMSDKITKIKKNVIIMNKEKSKIYKYISNNKRKRTKNNKTLYKENITKYITIKKNIKDLNVILNKLEKELSLMENKFDKYDKIIKNITDFKKIRTYVLKNIRNNIANKYIYNNDNETSIKAHILDCTIKLACASFKSAYTNYVRRNIEKFKIKYWSKNRSKKVMEIEGCYIINGTICEKIFGKLKMKYCESSKWIDYKLIAGRAIKLHYDSKLNKYSLFIPFTKNSIKSETNKSEYIGIDPGLRTMFTGIAKEKAIELGTNIYSVIEKYLIKIDKINKKTEYDNKTKNKKNRFYYNKINNIVDETHWKVINYLTDNFSSIYIGKLNMKKVVKNKKSNISAMTKRVGLMMKHYEFRERLIYKCNAKHVRCVEVDERYTSKICSKCGNYKDDLGALKVYDCKNCGCKIDRDVGSSRNMVLKNTIY